MTPRATMLLVGEMSPGTTSEQRARALRSLGFDLTTLAPSDFRQPHRFACTVRNRLYRSGLPVALPEPRGFNAAIVEAARRLKPGILWVDKGLSVRRATLEAIQRDHPSCRVIGFSPDDMGLRHNRSHDFAQHIGLYYAYITTKSYVVPELRSEGCPRVVFMPNAFDPETHRPMSDPQTERFRTTVGFVGTYERERGESIRKLLKAGIDVRICGAQWEGWPDPVPGVMLVNDDVWGDDYARALSAADINLCFLRKINRDVQTTRSVEIPACGGFMLAERTDEHRQLFEEDVEAAYFSSDDELIEKCRYYLSHPEERKRIAAAGRARCLNSRYDYGSRLAAALQEIGIAVPGRSRS